LRAIPPHHPARAHTASITAPKPYDQGFQSGTQLFALRAKIVLRCAEGLTNQQAATDLGFDRQATPSAE
ncbi:hypothetical protein, partial [Streptomyces sp. NPDC058394]|uniref:hypothetical protein n=1 Tax=Streptomyces sp. NPDC058394 TaxID=3346477 RepID=UPI00365063BC